MSASLDLVTAISHLLPNLFGSLGSFGSLKPGGGPMPIEPIDPALVSAILR